MVGAGFDWVCWDLGFLFTFNQWSLVGLTGFDQIWFRERDGGSWVWLCLLRSELSLWLWLVIIDGFDWVWSNLGLEKEMLMGAGFDWVRWLGLQGLLLLLVWLVIVSRHLGFRVYWRFGFGDVHVFWFWRCSCFLIWFVGVCFLMWFAGFDWVLWFGDVHVFFFSLMFMFFYFGFAL